MFLFVLCYVMLCTCETRGGVLITAAGVKKWMNFVGVLLCVVLEEIKKRCSKTIIRRRSDLLQRWHSCATRKIQRIPRRGGGVGPGDVENKTKPTKKDFCY